jgi:hypothetical protein
MTVWEVLLVFAGIPLGIFLLMAAAVYGATSRRSRRYRPGRPFEFRPVWFLSTPERIIGPADLPAQGNGEAAGMLPAGAEELRALEPAGAARNGSAHGVKGGASGSW